jgi:hypothetical protein
MELSYEFLIDIAGEMDIGMTCYIHRKTGELVSFPKDLEYSGFLTSEEENPWQDKIDIVNSDVKNFIEIEAMPSKKSYEVMEGFTFSLNDSEIKNQLIKALDGKKPFAHFKDLVHRLPDNFRKAWFDWKKEKSIDWIKEQLEFKMH